MERGEEGGCFKWPQTFEEDRRTSFQLHREGQGGKIPPLIMPFGKSFQMHST